MSLPRWLLTGLWWTACAVLVLAALAASRAHVLSADALDHLNNARWFWRGDATARLVDHRPPTLTIALLPLLWLYEYAQLPADLVSACCRAISVGALALAALATGRALPSRQRWLAPWVTLGVACSPLLLALAPVFSHDVCAAGGVGLLLWLHRRSEGRGRGALLALGVAGGAVALLRFDTGVALAGVVAGEAWSRSPRRALTVAALAAATGGGLLLGQFALGHGLAGAASSWLETAGHASRAVSEQVGPGPLGLLPAVWLRTAGPLLLILALVGAWRGLTTRDPVLSGATVALILGCAEHALVSNAQARYVSQLIPLAVLLAGAGFAAVPWRGARNAAVVAVAAVAWPLALGCSELWAFGDPVYGLEASRRLSQACQTARGGRVWLIGGNVILRPTRRAAFVAGDYSTRLYPVGSGALNFRLRRPVYYALDPALWQSLMRLDPADVALETAAVDFRAWPLERSQRVRRIRVARESLRREGQRLVSSWGGRGEFSGGELRLMLPRALGARLVIVRGPDGSRSLGLHTISSGELRLSAPAQGDEVVLLNASVDDVLDGY